MRNILLRMSPSKQKRRSYRTLAQTTVPSSVLRAFDRIAEREGHTRSSYLRLLIRSEVKSKDAIPNPTERTSS
jgi:hypothetical protein